MLELEERADDRVHGRILDLEKFRYTRLERVPTSIWSFPISFGLNGRID